MLGTWHIRKGKRKNVIDYRPLCAIIVRTCNQDWVMNTQIFVREKSSRCSPYHKFYNKFDIAFTPLFFSYYYYSAESNDCRWRDQKSIHNCSNEKKTFYWKIDKIVMTLLKLLRSQKYEKDLKWFISSSSLSIVHHFDVFRPFMIF